MLFFFEIFSSELYHSFPNLRIKASLTNSKTGFFSCFISGNLGFLSGLGLLGSSGSSGKFGPSGNTINFGSLTGYFSVLK